MGTGGMVSAFLRWLWSDRTLPERMQCLLSAGGLAPPFVFERRGFDLVSGPLRERAPRPKSVSRRYT